MIGPEHCFSSSLTTSRFYHIDVLSSLPNTSCWQPVVKGEPGEKESLLNRFILLLMRFHVCDVLYVSHSDITWPLFVPSPGLGTGSREQPGNSEVQDQVIFFPVGGSLPCY